ncbi:MAG TPA: CpaE family protein [Caulobacteraceae bacterium]|jgi:pilus assembly protein CpaE|nr:CpaE family protein [Caulobacteraceae bacterium]
MNRRLGNIREPEGFIEDDFGDGFDADDDFAFPATAAADIPEVAPAESFDAPVFAPGPAAPPHGPVAALQASAEAAFGESSVPRITIHAFCQGEGVADAMDKAAADRRLARATTLVHDGGLAEALAHYQNEPTPSLIVVESNEPTEALLDGLDRLAEVCDPGTKVVVVGGHNDIALYRELMRRGVSEYLVPPLNPLQLIRTITSLYADPATPFVGRTLAFVGAKGGVGASTIAHNVAYGLAEMMQSNTIIVDFDLAFGTAGLDFNQDPIQGVADALSKPDRLDPVLLDRMIVRCTDRLSLFAAPASLDDDYEYASDAYEEVATKIRATAPFVVYDLPHLWSGWMRRTLLAADEVVIVATPDLASLRNAKNLIDLIARARPNDTPPRLVLNQVGMPGRPEIPVKDFAKALGIEPTLCLPYDAKLFGQAANNGQMVQEVNGRAKASEGIAQFVQGLARRDAPVQATRSLLDRLLKR